MQLSELKTLPVQELIALGESSGVDNASRMKRQDVIFGILKNKAKQGEDIDGGGVLEILQDGFGFLRSPDSSYLAGPDDVYVSPSQIRRFGLRTGDTIQGKIRPPKEGERYFAILKIEAINFEPPEKSNNKVAFQNLTPLFPDQRMIFESGSGSTEDLSARVRFNCSNWKGAEVFNSFTTQGRKNSITPKHCPFNRKKSSRVHDNGLTSR